MIIRCLHTHSQMVQTLQLDQLVNACQQNMRDGDRLQATHKSNTRYVDGTTTWMQMRSVISGVCSCKLQFIYFYNAAYITEYSKAASH